MRESSTRTAAGVYLHVPYCQAVCHYCDFAKTANHDDEVRARYAAALVRHLDAWLAWTEGAPPLASLFVGGGTPSVYAAEYEPILARLAPRLAEGAEVTLEANPDDVTPESLRRWRGLGFNRISLGVQTFDARGLSFMKRTHSPAAATRAIEAAVGAFPSVNADLIYGWPGQSLAGLLADVERAVAAGASHLSLYTLTYEPRTPIGRAAARGRLAVPSGDELAGFYEAARERLGALGFEHEEVSNWSRPGHASRHNHLYWQDQPFVGIGAGAHGFLAAPLWAGAGAIGVRYAYPGDDRRFIRHGSAPRGGEAPAVATLAATLGVVLDEQRDGEAWLAEYVGSALRCRDGLDVAHAERTSGLRLAPNATVAEALAQGLLTLGADGRLRLVPAEWFREAGWGVEVLRSFRRAFH